MRLLRTDSLTLQSFDRAKRPRYAILSHRWSKEEDDEVTFQDVTNGTATSKRAYAKLRGAMQQTSRDHFDWIWCDTCCIDKSSSAELSEAINSMFSWYEEAGRCYVYIEEKDIFSAEELPRSEWFARGWTLQELIAPERVHFFSHDWNLLGSKKESRVIKILADTTKVDPAVLTKQKSLTSISIAKRMSWAAHRVVSRDEDIAYCLMGLFNVSMPMIYGEGGEKAFQRLQEQIMKDSTDHSIFAWRDIGTNPQSGHGLLAHHPQYFEKSSDVLAFGDEGEGEPYHLSNSGLRIELPLTLCPNGTFLAALNCTRSDILKGRRYVLAVRLRKLTVGTNKYRRVCCNELHHIYKPGTLTSIDVQQSPFEFLGTDAVKPWRWFQLERITVSSVEASQQLPLTSESFPRCGQRNIPKPNTNDPIWHLTDDSHWSPSLGNSIQSTFVEGPMLASGVLSFRLDSHKTTVVSLILANSLALEPAFAVVRGVVSMNGMRRFRDKLEFFPPGFPMALTAELSIQVDIRTVLDFLCKVFVLDILITKADVLDETDAASNPRISIA